MVLDKRTHYKIVREENGKLKWLFHGNFGTREITQYEWTKAQVRENAIDGKGIPYKSGFHVTEKLSELLNYAKRFKNRKGLKIVRCYIDGDIRYKKKSKTVILADKIWVHDIVWNLETNEEGY